MVDLHSHLLDELGSEPSKVLKELKKARRKGFKRIVFTPNVDDLKFNCGHYEGVVNSFNEVKEMVQGEGLDIEVILGAEVKAYRGVAEDLQNCIKETGKKKYVVIDISEYNSSIDELVYTLEVNGFTPVLTGLESSSFKHVSEHAKQWRDSGAKIMVTAKNVFGDTIKCNRVRKLIKRNQVDYISSGDTSKVNSFTLLRLARLYVLGVVGPKYAKQVFSLNARKLFSEDQFITE